MKRSPVAFVQILGLISAVVTILMTAGQLYFFWSDDSTQLVDLTVTLGICAVVLVIMLVVTISQVFSFRSQITEIQSEEKDWQKERADAFKRIEELETSSAFAEQINLELVTCFHSVYHYLRTTYYQQVDFMEFLKDLPTEQQIEPHRVEAMVNQFEGFLEQITCQIQNVSTRMTGCRCSVSIKLTKNGKFKTLYRDPVTYRNRRTSDLNQDGRTKVYDIADNSGFHMIKSNDHKGTTFLCDDLRSMNNYANGNHDWRNLYNATAIVPICKSNKPGLLVEAEVIAFLTVDNMEGRLANEVMKEMLCAIADGLYIIIKNFEHIVLIAQSKNIQHEKFNSFSNWDRG
jgi:hypothetical protein